MDLFDTKGHASYPYLFTDEGEIYCMPETPRARSVQLWRCLEFPGRWEKWGELISGIDHVADPTIFRYDNLWWLACADLRSTNLYLWWSERIGGEWHPHLDNPVKTDIGSARPGGTPFIKDEVLYRPAQDCSKRYGWRVVIHRVDCLTPSDFGETAVRVIEPFKEFSDGTHTLSSYGKRTLVDGKRLVFNWIH